MVKGFFGFGRKKKASKSLSEPSSSSSASDRSISYGNSPRSPLPNCPASSAFRIQDSDDLRLVFDKFDTNSDGLISSAELESMLRCLGHHEPREEVESMMAAADLDGDGFISLEEFLTLNTMETDSSKCIEDLKNAFTLYDRDENGLISAEELQFVLRSIGEKVTLADCRCMIKAVDRNGDGAVNFDEFVQMMTKSPT